MTGTERTLPAEDQFNYDSIKRCVSGDGWKDAVVCPSDLQVFEDVDYFAAHRVARRLVDDGILIPDGLHRWRRGP